MKKDRKVLILLTVCLVCVFLVAFVTIRADQKAIDNQSEISDDTVTPDQETDDETTETDDDSVEVDSFNGLLIGLDRSEGLTDVVMVGSFDAETNQVKIISVPRDLLIDFSEEPFKSIKEADPNNNISYCKLTEIYNNLGRTDDALKQLEKVISAIVGLDIDHMAVIDLDGFEDVVDAVGGVDFNVPQRMYYNDPAQDLHIDLQAGMQHLDGETAEEMIRFRRYTMGDLQRIEVQHDFLVAMYQKIYSLSLTDTDQLTDLAKTIYGMLDTDFGLPFVLNYTQYFTTIDTESLVDTDNMVTIPSYGETIDEISYQSWDLDEAHETVQALLDSGDDDDASNDALTDQDEEDSNNQETSETASNIDTTQTDDTNEVN